MKQTRKRNSRPRLSRCHSGGNHTKSHKTRKHHPHSNSKIIVVGKLYAEWCGHCRVLKPIWKKLRIAIARLSHHKNVIYKFAEIEQSNMQTKLAKLNETYIPSPDSKKVEIQKGFPTIFRIMDGNVEYYSGERAYLPLFKWFTQQNGVPHVKVTM
jgi:thiol-disulfide isomerase/thioredoxin